MQIFAPGKCIIIFMKIVAICSSMWRLLGSLARCALDRPRQMWQSWRDQKSAKPTEQQRLPTGCPVGNWNCNCNWNRNRHQQCHCQQQQLLLWLWLWGLFGSVRVRLSGDSANIQFNSLTGTQQAIKSLHIYIYIMYTRRHIYLFIIICRFAVYTSLQGSMVLWGNKYHFKSNRTRTE